MTTGQNLRPSPIAGTWYPGDPATLTRSIDQFLSTAQPQQINGQIKAILVPHAGHRYSGLVAAYAFNAIRGMPVKNVAVISPMHQFHPARLLTTAHDAYVTPLGSVPVNHKLVTRLSSLLKTDFGVGLTPVTADQEHSLEIQLPFLQRVFSDGFELVPVMMRDQSPDTARALANGLAKTMPAGSLLVASSDLSHFYSDVEAKALDGTILKAIGDFSPESVYQVEADERGYACGLGAITTILWAAREMGADKAMILNHATSGDVTGDRSSVVGYASAVIFKTK
ncbi:MAG: AmmeMemoRadiSam system protein B [Anaerolineaceae bacterium]